MNLRENGEKENERWIEGSGDVGDKGEKEGKITEMPINFNSFTC